MEQQSDNIDYADPAFWRLTVCMGAGRLYACLRNTSAAAAPLRTLVNRVWNAPPEETLRHIENAVYDNPSVLDDYSADIIIESDRALWVPAALTADEDSIADAYRMVYDAADDDVFCDTEGSASCLYHLTDGLGAFIRRTFPGARVTSQHTRLYRHFRRIPADGDTLYADLRGEKADILIMRRGELLQSSTHNATSAREAQYHILNCLTTAQADIAGAEIFISGHKERRRELTELLREQMPMVRSALLPNIAGADEDMPTAALLCAAAVRQTPETLQNPISGTIS